MSLGWPICAAMSWSNPGPCLRSSGLLPPSCCIATCVPSSLSRPKRRRRPSACCPRCLSLADYRAPDGGVPHAAAFGDEAISTCGMTAKEDKKTPARVGRVPGLILAQRWGRPSLAGGLFPCRKAELCGSEILGNEEKTITRRVNAENN